MIGIRKTNIGCCFFVRFCLYLVIPAIMLQAVVIATQKRQMQKLLIDENAVIEWFEIFLLMVVSLLLYISSKRKPSRSQLCRLLTILPLIAAVREFDAILDSYLFEGSWKLLVLLLCLYLIHFIWQNFAPIKVQVADFVKSNSFGFFCSGFITVMVFSRLIGQQVFWKAIMQQGYIYLVGRYVEELSEIFGYLLLLMGAIEKLIEAPPAAGGSLDSE